MLRWGMEYDNETLYLSIKHQDIDAVKKHLAAGIKAENMDPWSGRSAISACLEFLKDQSDAGYDKGNNKLVQIARLLLERIPAQKKTKALWAHMIDNDAPYIRSLASDEVVAELVKRCEENPQAMFTMAANGWHDNLELMIEHGAGVNIETDNQYKRSLLHIAVDSPGVSEPHRRARVAQVLLEAGIDPNAVDAEGSSALFGVRDVEVAQILIGYGARVDQLNNKNEGVLMGQWKTVSTPECVVYLIERGARIEQGPGIDEIETGKHKTISNTLLGAWKRKKLEEIGGAKSQRKPPKIVI